VYMCIYHAEVCALLDNRLTLLFYQCMCTKWFEMNNIDGGT